MTLSAAAVIAAASAASGGCRFSDPADEAEAFDRNAMLQSIGEHAILRTYAEFKAATAQLEAATSAYRSALGAQERQAAQNAWRHAASIWQRAETFQVGPAAPDESAIGGKGMREALYSWPTVNPCRVDQELVEKGYEGETFFQNELPNVYGLDALEYLLFVDGDADNACSPLHSINESTGETETPWQGVTDVAARRAAYADAAAAHLAEEASALHASWSPSGGNFLGHFGDAGREGSQYASVDSALEELVTALDYLEKVKDLKLGDPSGLRTDCGSKVCPDKLESRWAAVSKEHVLANVEGYALIVRGGSAGAMGLSDFLRARGADSVVADWEAKNQAARDAIQNIPGSLEEALRRDPEAVVALHAAVAALVSTQLDMATALKLQLTLNGPGDGD